MLRRKNCRKRKLQSGLAEGDFAKMKGRIEFPRWGICTHRRGQHFNAGASLLLRIQSMIAKHGSGSAKSATRLIGSARDKSITLKKKRGIGGSI